LGARIDRIHRSNRETGRGGRASDLDEQRIGGMYLSGWKQRWQALHRRLWHKGLMRSGMVTGLILAALVLGLGIAYREGQPA